jgi:T5orf172 domain
MTNNDYIQAESVKLHIGDLEFDAIRIVETGEYRMSQSQVLSAVGLPRNWLTRLPKHAPDKAGLLTRRGFTWVKLSVRCQYKKSICRAETYSLNDALILWRCEDKNGNPLAEELFDVIDGGDADKAKKIQSRLDGQSELDSKRKLRKVRMGYVYFIENSLEDAIKIGFSSNVTKRLKTLQVSSSSKLVLLKKIRGSSNKEKELHQKFLPIRLSGEWFARTPEIISFIEAL